MRQLLGFLVIFSPVFSDTIRINSSEASSIWALLRNSLEIEEWCKENNKDKKTWERKLPSVTTKDKSEKSLGKKLEVIRTIMQKYEGMKLEQIENEEDRQIVEIARRIYDKYAYGDKQLHATLGIALKIENWCKENFEKKKIWERRLPSTQSEDRFEAEIGVNLKCIRRRIKQYEGKDIAEIEDEDDKRIVEIIRRIDKEYAYGENQSHEGLGIALEIESWCKENFGGKNIWERRLPSARAKDKYEKELGKKINGIRGRIKKYTEMDLAEIEDEDDKKIVEIIRRLDEEYAYGDSQLHSNLGIALEIENWCKENNEGKKIWERKLPRTKCEDWGRS